MSVTIHTQYATLRNEYAYDAINNFLSEDQKETYCRSLGKDLKHYLGNVLLATEANDDLTTTRHVLDIVKAYPDAGKNEGEVFLMNLLKSSSTELNTQLFKLLCIVNSGLGEVFFKCSSGQDIGLVPQIIEQFHGIIPSLPSPCPLFSDFLPYNQGGKDVLDGLAKSPSNISAFVKAQAELDSKIIAEIGDVIRGTLIAAKLSHIPLLVEKVKSLILAKGGKVVGIKDFWEKPTSLGYVGVHLKVFMPVQSSIASGVKTLLGEVQIHHFQVMDGTLACPKELSHRLYKTLGEPGDNETPTELLHASNLIYLIGVTKLLQTENDKASAALSIDAAVTEALKDLAPECGEIIYSAIEAAQFLKANNYGPAVWDKQRKAIVPKNGEAVAAAFKDKTLSAKKWEKLSVNTVENGAASSWKNTAKSVKELIADATLMAPFFETLCKQAAESQEGCFVTFGPDNSCIKKEKSLQEKVTKDRNALKNK